MSFLSYFFLPYFQKDISTKIAIRKFQFSLAFASTGHRSTRFLNLFSNDMSSGQSFISAFSLSLALKDLKDNIFHLENPKMNSVCVCGGGGGRWVGGWVG